MGLSLNADAARKADKISSVIRETGAYIGVITRAEKLLSKNNVEGVGLSFRADDGSSANYLDLYTVKADGERLRGDSIVQALLCCLKLKAVNDGSITFEKWDADSRQMIKATAQGYPEIMNRRIGMVLQKELQTHQVTGAEVERLNIVTVFDPDTRMVATEILDRKTKAERLDGIIKMIMARPVRDSRQKKPPTMAQQNGNANHDFDDDLPF